MARRPPVPAADRVHHRRGRTLHAPTADLRLHDRLPERDAAQGVHRVARAGGSRGRAFAEARLRLPRGLPHSGRPARDPAAAGPVRPAAAGAPHPHRDRPQAHLQHPRPARDDRGIPFLGALPRGEVVAGPDRRRLLRRLHPAPAAAGGARLRLVRRRVALHALHRAPAAAPIQTQPGADYRRLCPRVDGVRDAEFCRAARIPAARHAPPWRPAHVEGARQARVPRVQPAGRVAGLGVLRHLQRRAQPRPAAERRSGPCRRPFRQRTHLDAGIAANVSSEGRGERRCSSRGP
mmetsp:Transcript_34120/g.105457  ORF Transcript_34120/g.105457 Transcript_34120/m.105457 type:complete len:292 (-) Transcript_34120:185-1060(-)